MRDGKAQLINALVAGEAMRKAMNLKVLDHGWIASRGGRWSVCPLAAAYCADTGETPADVFNRAQLWLMQNNRPTFNKLSDNDEAREIIEWLRQFSEQDWRLVAKLADQHVGFKDIIAKLK